MKQRRVLYLTVAAMLAASTWWLAQSLRQASEIQALLPDQPDGEVFGFEARQFGRDGKPANLIRAKTLRQFTSRDSVMLTEPHVTAFREDGPPWQIVADAGQTDTKGTEVLLRGAVNISKAAADGNAATTVITRDLRVHPRQNYAESDQPTTIIDGTVTLSGVGMRAWLGDERRLQLLSKVKARHEVH